MTHAVTAHTFTEGERLLVAFPKSADSKHNSGHAIILQHTAYSYMPYNFQQKWEILT